MNTTMQIRIDKKTKDAAQKAFKDMGMDLSSGVKIFLKEVAKEKTFPFIPSAKGYDSTKDIFDDIVREADEK
jgi:DNA-damage-inducible protein J